MTLPAGSRLGPYEILSPIGAGGMGEVYRARDTKLNRFVAIKVLPESLANDPDALARFEREAQAVAALNHPNILAIHDFTTQNGVSFAVTELLEGESLRELLSGGLVPLRKAVDFSRQLCAGLSAAHAAGIVHRDLKPDNVFVTNDGRVKILDFGLAKPAAGRRGSADETHSPTVSAFTEPGTVMGTVGYMSPEQVKGQPLDHRSDIFSFGAVLFEMLTGRRAFQRETAAETMTAILREEPPEPSHTGKIVSPALDRIVRHCLEKKPEQRFQSASDIGFALESVVGAPSGAEAHVSAGGLPRVRRSRWLALPLAALLVAAGVLAGRFGRRSGAAPAPRVVSFQQLTDAPGVESSPSLSPDGKSVVYVARVGGNMKLYLLRVGGRNPTLLTGDSPADDWQPAFSPDGERIAFRSERDGGGIFLMGSTGESVKRLTDYGFNPTWSPDGKEIVVSNGTYLFPTDRGAKAGGLTAVDVATGRKRVVSEAADAMQPSFSPHGKRIAFWGLRGNSGQRDLFTVAADGSEASGDGKDVTRDAALDWSPAWSPDGKWLWFSSNRGGTMNLWRVPIDEASGRVEGAPEAMTTPSLWSGDISFSRDGTKIAYGSLLWKSSLLRVAFDPKEEKIVGAPLPILKSTQPIRDHQVSPDGRWVAFMQTTNQEDIAIARIDGTEYRRLTDDRFRDRGPVWSPDGKTIAFYSDRGGDYQIWTIRPDGSGLKQLVKVDGASNLPVYSPNGSRMAFSLIGSSASPGGLALAELGASSLPLSARVVAMPGIGDAAFWPTSWSPDGGRLAGVVIRRDGTVSSIAVYDLKGGRLEIVSEAGDPTWHTVSWLSDGRRLMMRDKNGISLLDTATKRRKPLIDVGGYYVGHSLGVSSDDRSITYTETATEGDVWIAELK